MKIKLEFITGQYNVIGRNIRCLRHDISERQHSKSKHYVLSHPDTVVIQLTIVKSDIKQNHHCLKGSIFLKNRHFLSKKRLMN